jgi:hypothetical protein
LIQHNGCSSDPFVLPTDHSFYATYDITLLNFVCTFRH